MGTQWTLTKQLEDQDFADDISLLAHRHKETQTKLQHVADEAEKVGLQININKTEVFASELQPSGGNTASGKRNKRS